MSLTRRNLLVLAAAISLAGGSSIAHAAETLNVGSYPSNPPFEYKTDSGTFEGFEVDIVKEAAKRAEMTPEIADYGFQALFAGTSSKRIDVAISSITITPERLKSQSFTQPYYDSDMGIAAKADSAIKGIADLKGKTIGVLSGSTGAKWVDEHKAADGFADVKGYNAQQEMFLDLGAGRVDAVVSDVPGMEYLFVKMKGFAVKERIKTGEQYGLMMTKDSPLLGKLNDALTAMKKDGTLQAIHKKWFGSDAPAGSSTVVEMPIPKA
ncbi:MULTISPECIES: ABC transporter substrate-binding protein [unclassified Rhizobium]|uniref:ABC transporter substrate-binding protein n=1 Tax=unclassified Rhizobium TaxID=2613769 RepID=UPI001ADB4240|nr:MULTISPECIES: ABC transporter substrate-binding protein [unclassified Rhizobium]MBO9099299.1 amino acid ABC transporter substrate-binding protein [Rhizobium sp. L58/93]MBO9131895.1 amino acid ABC transporter substrate-binding protein [Rhizobium sp. B209b/85]MBO9169561.1 amino acid ABC transporter substrate-binding protein [Rhizobium sp. L245/93]MBO9185512.1 amino acid ABC transporter substrate-binding protein [Rhizobium sp. E27B/91]QXZ85642.1 amino acid ABC transporter substrate-binding pro